LKADRDIVLQVRPLGRDHIFVVDGLFAPDVVRMLHETLVRQPFWMAEYDNDDAKVRHWVSELPPDHREASPVLRVWSMAIVDKTRELMAGMELDLKRVHCNSHYYGDLQEAHTDLDPGATAIYYANAEWRPEWDGETIFFDESGEAFLAVAPRPGRVAIFRGGVKHRGGVPARICLEARLSVAFKFAAR
jgi:SM-20-related protein